jgi:hypothetical protein
MTMNMPGFTGALALKGTGQRYQVDSRSENANHGNVTPQGAWDNVQYPRFCWWECHQDPGSNYFRCRRYCMGQLN